MSIRVHTFDKYHDSGEVYNLTQTDESIKSGDVLVLEGEEIVGILDKAWPVAITVKHGEFHGPADPNSDYPRSEFPESVEKAEEIAIARKWPIGIQAPF